MYLFKYIIYIFHSECWKFQIIYTDLHNSLDAYIYLFIVRLIERPKLNSARNATPESPNKTIISFMFYAFHLFQR